MAEVVKGHSLDFDAEKCVRCGVTGTGAWNSHALSGSKPRVNAPSWRVRHPGLRD